MLQTTVAAITMVAPQKQRAHIISQAQANQLLLMRAIQEKQKARISQSLHTKQCALIMPGQISQAPAAVAWQWQELLLS